MPFDYTAALDQAARLVAAESPLFGHVDMDQVLISFAQTRKRTRHGIYAKMVPLRFEGGAREVFENGHRYVAEDFTFRGRDILYLFYVYLPRFHDQSFEGKVLTIFHELYHVSPRFDGDLRRLPGPSPYHGVSVEAYDAYLKPFGRDFLDRWASDPRLDFLRDRLEALEARHRGIRGLSIQQPGFAPVGVEARAPGGPGSLLR